MKILIAMTAMMMFSGCTVVATAFVEYRHQESNSKIQIEMKKDFTLREWNDLRR